MNAPLSLIQFTFFNNFAVLFHIAFFKEDMPLLRKVGVFSETVLTYNPKIYISTQYPWSAPQRLSSLLIVTQLVNQFTEVVVPFLVDRFITSADRNLKEDDPEVDHLQAQGSLPTFPVSSNQISLNIKNTRIIFSLHSQCCSSSGPVCGVHRAAGSVWLLEPFLLCLSSYCSSVTAQQPHRDPHRRLQALQALQQALFCPCGQHGRMAGQIVICPVYMDVWNALWYWVLILSVFLSSF